MNVVNQQAPRRHREGRPALREILFAVLVFASMGAITWAIRGTSGWGGIDGTVVPGMTWGLLWWFICWHKGIDARSVPLWLGLGIAVGGELGYGQYVSWIRGMFNAGDEIVPIAPWIGYAWLGICGVGWGGPGGIALGWTLGGGQSLGVWLSRLLFPATVALVARVAVQTWPGLFFPNWELGLYFAAPDGGGDPLAAGFSQTTITLIWLASALAALTGWYVTARVSQPGWSTRAISILFVGVAATLWVVVAEWLVFPEDQLGLFTGELGEHLGRTVYTNSQNAIVVGWWIGALAVACWQRDQYTMFAGVVIGVGFGCGFPLSALWCLGYEHAPALIDWWKLWELQAGFHLGMLYVAVLYWAIRKLKNDENRTANRHAHSSRYQQSCATISIAGGVFLVVYAMARGEFPIVGLLLGTLYVVALIMTMLDADSMVDKRRGISLVYSAFLLVFVMAWGGSSRAGVLLGLYDADAVDQYAWPSARLAIFTPVGTLIVTATLLKMRHTLQNPRVTPASGTASRCLRWRLVDLMTLTGVVGAVSIWPAKISVCYALLLGVALFAFNRLSGCLDRTEPRS